MSADRLPALIFDDGTSLRERAIAQAQQWQRDNTPVQGPIPTRTYLVIRDLLAALLSPGVETDRGAPRQEQIAQKWIKQAGVIERDRDAAYRKGEPEYDFGTIAAETLIACAAELRESSEQTDWSDGALRRERDCLQEQFEHYEDRAQVAEAKLAELTATVETLRHALAASRDVLAAFGKQAGWLPEQQAYSTRMTEGEQRLAEAVADIDRILNDAALASLGAQT